MSKRNIPLIIKVAFAMDVIAALYLVFNLGRLVGWCECYECVTPKPEVSTSIVKIYQEHTSEQMPEQELEPEPCRNGRYADIEITEQEIDELAALVWLEARGEPPEGQQAVAEVVLNRVLSEFCPDTVHDVIYDTKYGVQFSPYKLVEYTTGGDVQYQAVWDALYGENVLPEDVLYFSVKPHNDRIWGQIGGHWFCYV